jgi:hypothetical protein
VTILNSDDPNEKMISEWMHILLLQSSLTEFTLARGFISQNPQGTVDQAHHLQEGQEGRQEVVLYSQHCSHPSIKQDYRREKFKQDDTR